MNVLAESFLNKENLSTLLDRLNLEGSEKESLLKMVSELAEYRLLQAVLARLEKEDKELFMSQIYEGQEVAAVEMLRERIENVEELLRGEIKMLEKEILQDIEGIK